METYDEFDDPSRLQQKYSSMMSEEEYEKQASEETFNALQVTYLLTIKSCL